MPHRPVIDGFEFSESRARIQGVWALRDFPRLRELLAEDGDAVHYRLQGMQDEAGRPGLELEIRGKLVLECQRCLQRMDYVLEIDRILLLARTQDEIDAEVIEEDSPDRVLGSGEMAVGDLIEDELLLSLPYAPRHEACTAQAAGKGRGGVQQSAFADLRGLLGRSAGASGKAGKH